MIEDGIKVVIGNNETTAFRILAIVLVDVLDNPDKVHEAGNLVRGDHRRELTPHLRFHPNAVYDTQLWTDEVLEARARHYGISVQEYKTNNVLRTEVTSMDVAELVCTLAGPAFAKTTGAQVPIDGGNERVI